MKSVLVVGLLALATAFPAGSAQAAHPSSQGDVVRAWNDLTLRTVRTKSASDAQAARLYAMVNVAMYDSVNGLASGHARRQPALVPPAHGSNGDASTAAAGAAHDVLVALYPDQAGLYDAQLASDLAASKSHGQAKHGREWGGQVADGVLAVRASDGSSPPETQPAPPAPAARGDFPFSWSGVQFRNLAPFAIADPDAYVSPGPPALDSSDYAAAYAEVKGDGQRSDSGCRKVGDLPVLEPWRRH